MEGLTLSDRESYGRWTEHYRAKDRPHRSSRLPTPEDSQSSNEAIDSRSPSDAGASTWTMYPRQLPADQAVVMGNTGSAVHSRRDSRNTAAPYSPPYRSGDGQKPSLPPLKTVLGDNITSPPRTPSPTGNQMQLSPREPSYMALTYKPPALYPNKKQRVEPSLHSAPPFPGANSVRSPLPPSLTLEPRPRGSSLRLSVQFPPLSAPIDSINTRRASNASHSPPWATQYPPQHTKSSSHNSSFDATARHYQTPEQTPTTTMLEPSIPKAHAYAGPVQDPFAREMRESFAAPGEPPGSRRSSASGYGPYPSRAYEREMPPGRPYPPGTQFSIPMREGYADPRDSMRYGRPEEHARSMTGFGQPPYQSSVPAFFMPSHYEYSHGKARKRSNLPKRSTEIMKTWFDQNITNPYPSEEQKAVFSNATGISMTQVSNWFINHRRRCPELRDKRDKSRGGRDGEP